MPDQIERAMESGRQNQDTALLVANWCAHARIVRSGGIGLVEQMTKLPIGHGGMGCDHASAAGMFTYDWRDAVIEFHDRNCVGCPQRMPVGFPNISSLISKRDEVRNRREREARQAAEERTRSQQARAAEREALRGELDPVARTLLDEIGELDSTNGDARGERKPFQKTALVAKSAFTPPLVEYMFKLVERGESWFIPDGLAALQEVAVDRARLDRAALLCLARYRAIETAASIVQSSQEDLPKELVRNAVRALVDLANPVRHNIGGGDRRHDPGPLASIFKRYPTQVVDEINRFLNLRVVRGPALAARGIQAIASFDPEFPVQFTRSLAAVLARAHLLLDDLDDDHYDNQLHEVQEALALAWNAQPAAVDEIVVSYLEGSTEEGAARLLGSLRLVFHSQTSGASKANYKGSREIALKRLVQIATTNLEHDVLSVLQGLLQAEPTDLGDDIRSNSELMLGAAAILDGKLDELEGPPLIDRGEVGLMERANLRNMVGYVLDGMLGWVAKAAAGDPASADAYVAFYQSVASTRESLAVRIARNFGRMMISPPTINALLPTFYGAMLGPSVGVRGAAVGSLRDMNYRAVRDLPILVFEGVATLLLDPYKFVHKNALSATSRFAVPDSQKALFGQSVLNLILAYSTSPPGDSADSEFLIEAIECYASNYASEAELAGPVGQLLIDQLEIHAGYRSATVAPRLARRMAKVPNFGRLLIRLFTSQVERGFDTDEIVRALHQVPAESLRCHELELVAAAESLLKRADDPLAFIEALAAVECFASAAHVANLAFEAVPDTKRDRSRRLLANLVRLATLFELRVARGDLSAIAQVQSEWRRTQSDIGSQEHHEERFRPFDGILSED